MADADVPITAGSGTKIDTRTVGAGTDEHRQVIVVGDPDTAAGVAGVDATNGLDVDVTRVIPGTGATNLGKADDAVHSTSDVGVMALGVRADTAVTQVSAAGDYTPLIVDASGRLHVNVGAAPANQSTNIAQMNGVATTMGNGASGTGVQRVTLASDSTGNIATIGTSIVPGVAATHLGKAEDAVHASGDTGVFVLAVRQDSLVSLAGTTGDYSGLSVDSSGRLYVSSGSSIGDAAEDAALSGSPVRIAGRAHAVVPAAMSADNDVVTPWHDRNGAAVVVPQPRQSRITATPTIATSGYVANDLVGTKMTFANAALAAGRGGSLINAVLTSRTIAANAFELWLFQVDPTIASADSAAFDITDANLEAAQPFAIIDFAAANWKNTASGGVNVGTSQGGPVSAPYVAATTSIFGVLVARTVAAQYAGTTDLIVALTVNLF